jgi:hypothetical protein
MGFIVRSISQIADDDNHGYFLYYMPGRRLSYQWINDYFASELASLAGQIGPRGGLVIAPNLVALTDYSAELLARITELGIPVTSTRFLRSGFPFLIISRWPLHSDKMIDGSQPNFIAINLAALDEKYKLMSFIDNVCAAIDGLYYSEIEGEEHDFLKSIGSLDKDLTKQYNDKYGRYSFAFSEALELKPNIMGIGVNLNSIIHDVLNNLHVRRERRKKIGL